MFFPFPQPTAPQDFSHLPLAKRIQVVQIIWFALITGVLMFAGIALMAANPKEKPVIAYLGLGGAIVIVVLRFIVPGIVVRAQTKNLSNVDESQVQSRLIELFQTRLIIGMALLEGACFFNLVSYLAEGQRWTLAVVGILLVLMVAMFPSVAGFEAWAEDIQRELKNQF